MYRFATIDDPAHILNGDNSGWLLRLTPITITEVDPESVAEWSPDSDRSIDIEKVRLNRWSG